jgi:16S rRNA (guanine1516-N2)-methyltransferase
MEVRRIAQRFNLPLLTELPAPQSDTAPQFILQLSEQGLGVHDLSRQIGRVAVDFASAQSEYRRLHGGGKNQTLARAIGLKHQAQLNILDLTAGLGRDAFVLASLGCRVQMVERSPVLTALLEDALQRAYHIEAIAPIVARLQLTHAQAADYLRQTNVQADVIYLDPMYPHRQKAALVKKEMRVLRAVVGDDEDAGELLGLAINLARLRVVVKRPKTAPTLNMQSPTLSLTSENTRFDIYVTKKTV